MYRTPAPNARERAPAGRSPSPVAATPVGTPPGRRNVNLRHPRREARSLLASVAGGARRSGRATRPRGAPVDAPRTRGHVAVERRRRGTARPRQRRAVALRPPARGSRSPLLYLSLIHI